MKNNFGPATVNCSMQYISQISANQPTSTQQAVQHGLVHSKQKQTGKVPGFQEISGSTDDQVLASRKPNNTVDGEGRGRGRGRGRGGRQSAHSTGVAPTEHNQACGRASGDRRPAVASLGSVSKSNTIKQCSYQFPARTEADFIAEAAITKANKLTDGFLRPWVDKEKRKSTEERLRSHVARLAGKKIRK